MSSPSLRVMMKRPMRELILSEFEDVLSRLGNRATVGDVSVKMLQRICGLVNFVLTHSQYKMNLSQVVFLLRLASEHTSHSLRCSLSHDADLRSQVERALKDLAEFVLRDETVTYIDRERLDRGRITVYTDAALSPAGVGGSMGPTLGLGGVIVTPDGQIATFSFVDSDPRYAGRTIMAYELLAVELAIELWGDMLRDKWALFKVDNMAAVYALTRWSTTCPVCMDLVSRIQWRLRTNETLPYWSWIATQRNSADLPSRMQLFEGIGNTYLVPVERVRTATERLLHGLPRTGVALVTPRVHPGRGEQPRAKRQRK